MTSPEKKNAPGQRANAAGGSEIHLRAGLGTHSSDGDDAPGLFAVHTVVESDPYSRRTRYEFSANEYARGPGPRPATTGPMDAKAPAHWERRAERFVMDRINSGRTCTSDDLHDAIPDEPSASGAAFGGLFARLTNAGLIVEVGMTKSRRPEARRRRIIVWGAAR